MAGKIHANTKKELRKCNPDETVVYGGGGFHIVKKDKVKRKK